MARVTTLRLHLWTILAAVLDIGTTVLVAITYHWDVMLPWPKNTAERSLQNLLPTFASMIGGVIAYVNVNAINALVTVYTRKRMSTRGVTLAELNYLTLLCSQSHFSIAQGGLPRAPMAALFLAIAIMLAGGFVASSVVHSLSPTPLNWSDGNPTSMPLVSFSAGSGVAPPIYCANGAGNVNQYGYGINCPLDTVYGEMYNAFTDSLRGTFPVNSTYDGASYPSSLMGLSGAISTLTQRYANGNQDGSILPTDTFDACLPRTIVSATCSPNLPSGFTVETQTLSVSGNTPKDILQMALCQGSSCSNTRWAPDYGNGVISTFLQDDLNAGTSTLVIFSTGTYATNISSPNIYCTVAMTEEFVPIRITGGNSASLLPDLTCQNQTAPTPLFMANITRLSQMALEKSQGQDGRIEAISFIPSGTDHVQAIELGIERMVSVAATNMYSTITALQSSNATWSHTEPYLYQTLRYRLGVSGRTGIIFILAPIGLFIIVVAMWSVVGISDDGMVFNPLAPLNTIVAGMNRERLPVEIADLSEAKGKALEESNILLRYGWVNEHRMGVIVGGSSYIHDSPMASPAPMAYKDESPLPTPGVYAAPPTFK
ncbi:hypothetical protein DL93DRAFT_2154811 [Clavulina sp. PMI_390]|nr:hypothetical protein DL93DRAFT_2154811 [Clavulina sp. PMI_390]